MTIDVEAVRKDFPILSRQVHGRPLVYLDNAATSQKPRAVIDALVNYYENYNANIHRGMYQIAIEATDAHEEAHRLEHAISPRVEDRLAELLGMPSTCPHGNPIPGMPKPLTRVEPFPLAQAREGAVVVVERITEEAEADKNLLEHLWRHNVRPGRRLKITEVAPWAGTITASGDGQSMTLGLPAAAKIWVYLPKDAG